MADGMILSKLGHAEPIQPHLMLDQNNKVKNDS